MSESEDLEFDYWILSRLNKYMIVTGVTLWADCFRPFMRLITAIKSISNNPKELSPAQWTDVAIAVGVEDAEALRLSTLLFH